VVRLQFTIAAALAVIAVAMAIAIPTPRPQFSGKAMIVEATGSDQTDIGSARLSDSAPATVQISLKGTTPSTVSLPPGDARHEQHEGIAASAWTLTEISVPPKAPATLTLDQVIALSGGRVPMGLNPQRHPGPFAADWSTHATTEVWTADGVLLDAAAHATTIVSLSGSGLLAPRTLTAASALPGDWQLSNDYLDQAAAALNAVALARTERLLWAVQLPLVLGFAALLLSAIACRGRGRLRRSVRTVSDQPNPHVGRRAGHSTP
jgi:high-affinity iron transporter